MKGQSTTERKLPNKKLHIFFENDNEYIKNALNNGIIHLDSKSPNNSDLLHFACLYKNKEIAEYLITTHSDFFQVNKKNDYGSTPLDFACSTLYNNKKSSLEIIKYLLDIKAKSPAESPIEIIKYLLDIKADVNLVNKLGYTPLHSACEYNIDFEAIKCLVDNKTNLNLRDKSGFTPLFSAFRHDSSIEITKYLIDNKTDVNLVCNIGSTVLGLLCSITTSSIEMVKYLLDNKANINLPDEDGCTPLHYACENKKINHEIIKCLVENKSDVNVKNHINQTPFDLLKHNPQCNEKIIELFTLGQIDDSLII